MVGKKRSSGSLCRFLATERICRVCGEDCAVWMAGRGVLCSRCKEFHFVGSPLLLFRLIELVLRDAVMRRVSCGKSVVTVQEITI